MTRATEVLRAGGPSSKDDLDGVCILSQIVSSATALKGGVLTDSFLIKDESFLACQAGRRAILVDLGGCESNFASPSGKNFLTPFKECRIPFASSSSVLYFHSSKCTIKGQMTHKLLLCQSNFIG